MKKRQIWTNLYWNKFHIVSTITSCQYTLVCPSLLQKLELKAKHLPKAGQIPQKPPKKYQIHVSIFKTSPCVFVFTKEFWKNTKENMPSDHFCSHFLQEGRVNFIPSPECWIVIAVSEDTHIEAIWVHMPTWLYGQNHPKFLVLEDFLPIPTYVWKWLQANRVGKVPLN